MSSNPGSLTELSQITLQIGSERLSGWTGLQVIRAIDSAADAFSFSLPWNPTPENRERFRPFFVRPVRIYVDDTLLTTGYIEKTNFTTNGNERSLNVQGRSASGTIIDWSAGPPFQLENLSFNNISRILTQAIYSEFTAGVAFASPDTPVIGEVSIDPGQSYFDVMSSIAGANGLWARPTAQGRLEYLKLSSTRQSVAALVEGTSPVRLVSTDHDVTKRFQLYRVIGQSEGEPEIEAEVSDYESLGLGVRGRKIEQLSQQSGEIIQAARFSRSKSIIESYSANTELDGWHYQGRLWTPGDIITLTAPGAYIESPSRFIITRATMQIDETGGQVTNLDLSLPEVFDGTEPRSLPWVG